MSKKIALFGGSFDPPHEGHQAIVRLLASKPDVDEVWILPVFKHPLGKKVSDFSKRLQTCRHFFKNLGPKVFVKDIEKRLGGTSWTIRLIRHLKQKHPFVQFLFVMGEDAYQQRKEWKDFEKIKREVEILVIPRGPDSFVPNISSTELRRLKFPRPFAGEG